MNLFRRRCEKILLQVRRGGAAIAVNEEGIAVDGGFSSVNRFFCSVNDLMINEER